MRIWSVHPKYLDTKGLVALWRETILAKHVLEGRTKGYRNHPQLIRFKQSDHPLDRINQYLATVYEEATRRGYTFDKEKIDWNFSSSLMKVTSGQLQYEKEHLLRKLNVRDPQRSDLVKAISKIDPHPMFKVVKGGIEAWEII
ncbi:hypothetical protein PIECOFPK_00597 [Mycovorax composti]|jgi:hypothetical protein|uniref:DNA lyase n=2 Tax=Chitinophagaceae TaxID=563835 RepID=A0ABZ2EHD1_9BACT